MDTKEDTMKKIKRDQSMNRDQHQHQAQAFPASPAYVHAAEQIVACVHHAGRTGELAGVPMSVPAFQSFFAALCLTLPASRKGWATWGELAVRAWLYGRLEAPCRGIVAAATADSDGEHQEAPSPQEAPQQHQPEYAEHVERPERRLRAWEKPRRPRRVSYKTLERDRRRFERGVRKQSSPALVMTYENHVC